MSIFVLGGPGCGKTTQCKLLADKFGATHIAVGDLLRKSHDPEIVAAMNAGEIVCSDKTVSLLHKKIPIVAKIVLIDGFPRNLENLFAWQQKFGTIPPLIFIECPEAILKERLIERGRADDYGIIEKRFAVLQDQTMPVVQFYQQHHPRLFTLIDGNRDEEEVADALYLLLTHWAQMKSLKEFSLARILRQPAQSLAKLPPSLRYEVNLALFEQRDKIPQYISDFERRVSGRSSDPESHEQLRSYRWSRPTTIVYQDCDECDFWYRKIPLIWKTKRNSISRGFVYNKDDSNVLIMADIMVSTQCGGMQVIVEGRPSKTAIRSLQALLVPWIRPHVELIDPRMEGRWQKYTEEEQNEQTLEYRHNDPFSATKETITTLWETGDQFGWWMAHKFA